MISSTLVASLIVALTVIPLMASRLLAKRHRRRNLVERIFGLTDVGVRGLARFYLAILRTALCSPASSRRKYNPGLKSP